MACVLCGVGKVVGGLWSVRIVLAYNTYVERKARKFVLRHSPCTEEGEENAKMMKVSLLH